MAKWTDPKEADEATRYLLQMYPEAISMNDTSYGYPLHLAARRRSLEVLHLLHKMHPQSVSIVSRNSGTCLYQAALSGDVRKIKYIHDAYPDAIKTKTKYINMLPIHAVFNSGRPDGIADEDMAGFEVDRGAKTAIAMARAQVDDEAVSFLFAAYPEAAAIADGEGKYPLARLDIPRWSSWNASTNNIQLRCATASVCNINTHGWGSHCTSPLSPGTS
jgi:hypothetical protein